MSWFSTTSPGSERLSRRGKENQEPESEPRSSAGGVRRSLLNFSGMARQGTWLVVLKDLREGIPVEEERAKIRKEFAEKLKERDQYARELQAMKGSL